MTSRARTSGFTLIEMVMVIVIMGAIGGMVAVFMKSPIDAYVDSARRAELTDAADTAVRRIARDLRKALPNSIRDDFNHKCISFIPTRTGGRYRADGGANGLDFSTADSGFNMLGANSLLPADQQIRVDPTFGGDLIAIYNLGIPGADAYANPSENVSAVTGLGVESGSETPISITAKQFPFESPSSRFQVIPGDEKVVTYSCNGNNLYRSVSTAFPLVLPAACPTSGQILASNAESCTFDYSGSDLQRNALVKITLTFTKSNESVNLYHEVHVSNTP